MVIQDLPFKLLHTDGESPIMAAADSLSRDFITNAEESQLCRRCLHVLDNVFLTVRYCSR